MGIFPHDKPLRTYDIHIPTFSRIFLHIAIEVQNNCRFFDCVDMSRVERFSCHKEDKDHHDRVPGKYVFHKPISSGMVYRKTSTCQSIFWLQVQFDRKSIWIWLKFRNSICQFFFFVNSLFHNSSWANLQTFSVFLLDLFLPLLKLYLKKVNRKLTIVNKKLSNVNKLLTKIFWGNFFLPIFGHGGQGPGWQRIKHWCPQ